MQWSLQWQETNTNEDFRSSSILQGLRGHRDKWSLSHLFVKRHQIQAGLFSTILGFLEQQIARVNNREITGTTVRNYVKAIKLICEMADIPIQWKKSDAWTSQSKELCWRQDPLYGGAKATTRISRQKDKAAGVHHGLLGNPYRSLGLLEMGKHTTYWKRR